LGLHPNYLHIFGVLKTMFRNSSNNMHLIGVNYFGY
jgi:hypothetical protein